MKNILSLLGLGLSFLITPIAWGENLEEIYALALINDPIINESINTNLANDEIETQVRSLIIPRFTLTASMLDLESVDPNRPRSYATGELDPNIISTETTTESTGWSLNVIQVLFDWSKIYQLRQAQKTVELGDLYLLIQYQNLILRVTNAYFSVLSAQENLVFNERRLARFQEQLEQAERRFELGALAITDLQLIQSQRDLAVTGVLFAQRSLIEQEDLLAEIIGTRVEYLAPLDNGFQFNLPSPSNLEDWIELGLEANFELNASLLENQIAYHNYQAVRSTRLPTLNFSASMSSSATDILRYNQLIDDAPCLAYGGNPACPAEYTESESELDDVRLSLNFSLPLFSGGLLSSQIRQASFQYEATNYAITRQQRQLERAIRSSFLGVELGISQIRAYEQAILSAQTALQASERAFSLGAATTSDILFAEENLLNAQVNLSNAKKDFILNSFNLKALIGNLTAEDISLLSESLN